MLKARILTCVTILYSVFADPKTVYFGPSLTSIAVGDDRVCVIVGVNLYFGDEPYSWIFGCILLLERSWWMLPSFARCRTVVRRSSSVLENIIQSFAMRQIATKNLQTLLQPASTSHACVISIDGKSVCRGKGAPQLYELPNDKMSFALGNSTTCVLNSFGMVHCLAESILPTDLTEDCHANTEVHGHVLCRMLRLNYIMVCWNFDDLKHGFPVFKQVLANPCVSSCPCFSLSESGSFCSN